MSRVVRRKNVTVSYDFTKIAQDQPAEWTIKDMGVPFEFDEVIIKQITFCSDTIADEKLVGVFMINCPQLGGIIGSFFDGCSVGTNIRCPAINVSPQDWQFSIWDSNSTTKAIDYLQAGSLSVHMEFLAHSK